MILYINLKEFKVINTLIKVKNQEKIYNYKVI